MVRSKPIRFACQYFRAPVSLFKPVIVEAADRMAPRRNGLSARPGPPIHFSQKEVFVASICSSLCFLCRNISRLIFLGAVNRESVEIG
jgi:hypothetical protein